jgi:hypothetical protein
VFHVKHMGGFALHSILESMQRYTRGTWSFKRGLFFCEMYTGDSLAFNEFSVCAVMT